MEEQAGQAIQLIVNSVPNLDVWVQEFIKQNWLTSTFALGFLKIIAKKTPWAVDDEIVQLFTGLLPIKKIQKS